MAWLILANFPKNDSNSCNDIIGDEYMYPLQTTSEKPLRDYVHFAMGIFTLGIVIAKYNESITTEKYIL